MWALQRTECRTRRGQHMAKRRAAQRGETWGRPAVRRRYALRGVACVRACVRVCVRACERERGTTLNARGQTPTISRRRVETDVGSLLSHKERCTRLHPLPILLPSHHAQLENPVIAVCGYTTAVRTEHSISLAACLSSPPASLPLLSRLLHAAQLTRVPQNP
jgi:hypothetical protein